MRLRRRDPDLGRRHGRHALRALSRPRRAAPSSSTSSRIARVIQQSDARHADGVAAFSLGQGRRLPGDLREAAAARGLGFDAVNSNTFPGPARAKTHSYKFGSLSHADPASRALRPSRTISNASSIGEKLGSKALTVWIARRLELRRPVEPDQGVRPLSRRDAPDLRRPARGLAGVPRTQALRAGLLLHRHFRLGQQLHGGDGAGAEGQVPRRSRPSRAERQYRADRRPAGPLRQARGFPLQRFEIWRRRSRRGLDRPVPAVPRLQRTGRRGRARGRGLRAGLHARPVAQRHRPDREPDALGDRTCSAPMRRR